MITPKERAQILIAQVERDTHQARVRARVSVLILCTVALGGLASLTAGAWLGAKSARRQAEYDQVALLVRLGADPIKARCVVERITDDNRDLCLKLVTDGGDQ